MIFSTWMSVAFAASVALNPGDDIGALTSSLLPGDVITFNAGTFDLAGTVYWTGAGTPEAPITFRAATDAQVILRNMGGGYGAVLSDSSYVVFERLSFEGGGDDLEYTQPSGLAIDGDSSNITVRDCTFRNLWGTALRIDGNASGFLIQHNEMAQTGDGSGIYVGCYDGSCWMQDSKIVNNLLHDLGGAGIYLSHGTQANVIQDNVIFRAADDGLYAGSTLLGPQNQILGNAIWNAGRNGMYLQGSALVQNNVIFEIVEDGIYTSASYEDDDSLTDIQISHNTVANTNGYAANLEDFFFAEGAVFTNNALANPIGRGMWWEDASIDRYGEPTGEETDNYIRNNVVTGLVEGFDVLARDGFVIPGGGVSDFEDISAFDFYPTPGSALRDAADPSGEAYLPAVDFNGTQRDGASPDVGAYEYDAETNPGWVIQEGYKSLQPSAGRGDANLSTGCCNKGDDTATAQAVFLLPVLSLGWLRRRRSPRP